MSWGGGRRAASVATTRPPGGVWMMDRFTIHPKGRCVDWFLPLFLRYASTFASNVANQQ